MHEAKHLSLESIRGFLQGSKRFISRAAAGPKVTRLIGRFVATGRPRPTAYKRHRFPARYTRADVDLLARADEAHVTLSGPATRHICQREHAVYGQGEFARLATISVAHLDNLRRTASYSLRLLPCTRTRPTQAARAFLI